MFISGDLKGRSHTGEPLRDCPFFIIFNGGAESVDFRLPNQPYGTAYTILLDSASPDVATSTTPVSAGAKVTVAPFGAVVMRVARPGGLKC